jgi:hypothetical protein
LYEKGRIESFSDAFIKWYLSMSAIMFYRLGSGRMNLQGPLKRLVEGVPHKQNISRLTGAVYKIYYLPLTYYFRIKILDYARAWSLHIYSKISHKPGNARPHKLSAAHKMDERPTPVRCE